MNGWENKNKNKNKNKKRARFEKPVERFVEIFAGSAVVRHPCIEPCVYAEYTAEWT
jgi:hypothetical protein